MSYQDILAAQLRVDEGVRKKPYTDTVGKTTVGCGRNLTDVGVSNDEIDLMLANDMARSEAACRRLLTNFDELSDARKAVVCNLAFNIGEHAFGFFHDTLNAIQDGRWNDAATAMESSRWAAQVGARSKRLADAMRAG